MCVCACVHACVHVCVHVSACSLTCGGLLKVGEFVDEVGQCREFVSHHLSHEMHESDIAI